MNKPFDPRAADMVSAKIVFGSPRRNCRNLGICRIEPIKEAPDNKGPRCCGPSAQANLLIDSYLRLLIHFPARAISQYLLDTYFPQANFTITDPLCLKPEMSRLLGCPDKSLTLLPGRYPVLDVEAEGLLLSLQLEVLPLKENTVASGQLIAHSTATARVLP